MTLYKIRNEIIDALDEATDPETGEITASDAFEKLDALQMAFEEKAENTACYIKNLDAEAKAIREEEKALAARRRSLENRAERCKSYLQFCLNGEKFSTPRCAVSYKRSTSVLVDENRLFDIPEEFLRYKEPEVKKNDVRDALKAGQDVPGCSLVESVSMIIK
jgi:hypothetical protein